MRNDEKQRKNTTSFITQGPRSKFLSGGGGGAKDERVSQVGVGGGNA